jgi:uncharacterized RDD family membrane protein YckC
LARIAAPTHGTLGPVSAPPGWHPDPVPQQPGQPPLLRYWDGTKWTEHTAAAPPPGPDSGPPPYAGAFGATPYSAYPATGQDRPASSATTPDGVPLAGWGRRGFALTIDGVIVAVVAVLLSLPWWIDVVHDVSSWMSDAMNAPQGTTPDTTALLDKIAKPLLIIGLVSNVLRFVYYVGFLRWKQATPGMLALGMRVRLRERPGPMPMSTVLLRWLGHYGPALLSLAATGGAFSALYSLVDYLWPLWDGKKQAVHDKIARTNVVRVG